MDALALNSEHAALVAAGRMHADRGVRTLAEHVGGLLLQGVCPAPRHLATLGRACGAKVAVRCSRMEDGGKCAWLRKHGTRLSLPVAPVGEPALCLFQGKLRTCPGFRERRT